MCDIWYLVALLSCCCSECARRCVLLSRLAAAFYSRAAKTNPHDPIGIRLWALLCWHFVCSVCWHEGCSTSSSSSTLPLLLIVRSLSYCGTLIMSGHQGAGSLPLQDRCLCMSVCVCVFAVSWETLSSLVSHTNILSRLTCSMGNEAQLEPGFAWPWEFLQFVCLRAFVAQLPFLDLCYDLPKRIWASERIMNCTLHLPSRLCQQQQTLDAVGMLGAAAAVGCWGVSLGRSCKEKHFLFVHWHSISAARPTLVGLHDPVGTLLVCDECA